MQPNHDSWEYESSSFNGNGVGPPSDQWWSAPDPAPYETSATGLVDISKGKGKGNGCPASDAWDAWDSSGEFGGCASHTGPGGCSGFPDQGNGAWDGGKGGYNGGATGSFDGGGFKGGDDSSYDFGDGGWDGDAGKGNLSFKGGGNKAPASLGAKVIPGRGGKGKVVPATVVPPPSAAPGTIPGTVTPINRHFQPAPRIDGKSRGPQPMIPAPRLPVVQPPPLDGKGTKSSALTALGNALASIANAAARGSAPAVTAPPPPAMRPPTVVRPANTGLAPLRQIHGVVLPPPGMTRPTVAPPPHNLRPPMLPPQGAPPRPLALLPPAPTHVAPPSLGGLAPELAALTDAADADVKDGPLMSSHTETKPRIIMLITRLAPELEERHMQVILEQCGEVQAWRRGMGPTGEPLSFGFVQFGDPEAAWKVSTCLSKRVLCGKEIKVLVEEQAESVIQAWRSSQQAALKVNTDEELEWELERKTVSCKALIDAKLEELYGPAQDGDPNAVSTGGAGAQRWKELREREQARAERTRKRKAWRNSEFQSELERIESDEKRLRTEEREKDDADREREETEIKDKQTHDIKLARMEELGSSGSILASASAADAQAIYELVDRVQAEPRHELFKMELDVAFLRDEKIFEKKLRPWLERKVDFFMGGPQSDLVEYILRRVNAASYPDALITDLTRYLDDNADALVERMWRMLVLELTRGGHGLSTNNGKAK